MKENANEKELSVVPMEIAVAVSTERTLFVDMMVAKVRKGDALSKDQLLGILKLLKEFIDERVEIRQRMNKLTELSQNVQSLAQGHARKIREMHGFLIGRTHDQDSDDE